MEIYTIGFAGKTAEEFFGLLKRAGIKRLVDIRLNNSSQLAGFTKADNLPYFLKEICKIKYEHELLLTPTKEIMDAYKGKKIDWPEYEKRYRALLTKRRAIDHLDRKAYAARSVLLCSEPTAEHCHRRIAAEYLNEKWGGVKVVHL